MTAEGDRSAAQRSRLGVVAIGRNEGARLARCLDSLKPLGVPVAYADSNSTDGSAERAAKAGAIVIKLAADGLPLNAARGRNAGLAALLDEAPDTAFVQFIDGDCILEPHWVETALDFLGANAKAAVVCGRRREAFPEASFYNRLADEEWNTPVGEATESGGDSIMRVAALEEVGHFDPTLMAGEEPELCSRIRSAGWSIWRIDAPMTVHDMAMTRLSQWMRRARRSGMGYAQAYGRTRNTNAPLYARELRSALAWAVLIPLLFLGLAWLVKSPIILVAVPVLYIAQIVRMAMRRGVGSVASWQYGALMMVSKIPEAAGALSELFDGRSPRTPAS